MPRLRLLLRQRVVETAADEALGCVERVRGVGHSLRARLRRQIESWYVQNAAEGRACRLAGMPTSRSPLSVKATTEGVVRAPSAFSITLALCGKGEDT